MSDSRAMGIIKTTVVVFAAAYLFQRLRVPAGALIGAMLGATLLNLLPTGSSLPLPSSARFLAFAAIGWAIGHQFTPETVSTFRQAVVPIALTVGVLVVSGGAIALVLWRSGVDAATAFLAASPGALSQMAALSAQVGADGPPVVTVHLIRIVTVILLAPIVTRLIQG